MGRDMDNFAKWQKANLRQFVLKLNRKNDGDMIDFLEKKDNVRQYLIGLIREDMEKSR